MSIEALESAITILQKSIANEQEACRKLKEFRIAVKNAETQYHSALNIRKEAASLYSGCTINNRPNQLYIEGIETRMTGITANAIKVTFVGLKAAIDVQIALYNSSISGMLSQVSAISRQIQDSINEEENRGC